MPEKPPNILYLHSHDTGRYVSPYGYRVRTPNMQRFAEEGVLFRQTFCNNPTCSPSRACLLTGRYAHNNGMLGLAHRGWRLNDDRQHLCHTLKAGGYHTALCGMQHVAHYKSARQKLGYDDQVEVEKFAEQRAESACDYLRQYAANQQDDPASAKPLFMSFGTFETHRPFPDHEPADDPRYGPHTPPFADSPQTRDDFADYATMVNRLDAGYGRILATLEQTGLDQNTLVIITTDHGIAFPGMKCSLTDHGLGVSLMMRGPANSHGPAAAFGGGQVVEPMTQHLDLFPTICDVAGIDHPDWLQGKSLLPLVRGEVDSLHEQIFGEVNYHAAYEPKRCVRTQRYKFIRRYHDRDRPVLPNCDESISKTYWRENGWDNQRIDRERLYDTMFDPNETANLVDDPDYRQIANDMRTRLDEWMQSTDDPILRGPIPLAEGGQVNTHDQPSPDLPTVMSENFDPNKP